MDGSDGVLDLSVTQPKDVPEEVIDAAWEIAESFYLCYGQRINWEALWDRLESWGLEDGTAIEVGTSLTAPALKKIQREVRKRKKGDA